VSVTAGHDRRPFSAVIAVSLISDIASNADVWQPMPRRKTAMPALSEALVPTERDVIVAKESQRQMGGMKFGRKESVAVQIDGKEVVGAGGCDADDDRGGGASC
jgi:hypothetical protein